jgi:hypothetical protein
VAAVERFPEAFLHSLPAVARGRIGFEVLQAENAVGAKQIFLFVLGNAIAFLIADAVSTRGFSVKVLVGTLKVLSPGVLVSTIQQS